MDRIAINPADRRREPRCAGGGTRWRDRAVLRPGVPVVLVNINTRAALVESDARLRPGANTEMQLSSATTRASVRGRVDRCYVSRLEPIRYRGVVFFDERIALDEAPRS